MTEPIRLEIEPVVQQAAMIVGRVEKELPAHDGLQRAARMVVGAAQQAGREAAKMRRPLSLHRLPPLFLGAALVALLTLLYWQFFHVATLTLALPDRDAADLRSSVADARLRVQVVEVPGSREAAALLAQGKVDLGFVQGGIPIPTGLLRLEAPSRELVLYFVRDRVTGPAQVKTVLTSVEGEGSHTVAQAFFAAWGAQVTYLHTWKQVTASADDVVPDAVDAVFVVKDPGDEQALVGAQRLGRAGFHLTSVSLGARARRFDFLQEASVPAGYLAAEPPLPAAPVATYSVATFLVAREGLTPRLLTQAAAVLQAHPGSIAERSFHLSSSEASELLQGADALLSIVVNIGLAFLALLGLDVVAYRRRFHELNSLVSLLSMLQANKDVLGREGAARAENLVYLELCSDLLSLISAVSGYYTQENSALLFNNLSEVVHQRCDALKINIQLKLLHAGI
jgi:hypothetical protein